LHYETLLGSRVCVHIAAAAWACGVLHGPLYTANTISLPLCQGKAVEQFFCEIPQILKLSCSTSYLRELWVIVIGGSLAFVCFVFIVVSYVQIFRAVLRIPSQQGRHKAFATCLPHLAVVSLFVSTVFFAYLKPPSISSPSLDLVVSVLYSVVPPGPDSAGTLSRVDGDDSGDRTRELRVSRPRRKARVGQPLRADISRPGKSVGRQNRRADGSLGGPVSADLRKRIGGLDLAGRW
ncbi:olfactory receptor 14J1-like, partial [Dryobates pubescens]|uniref:olfactory receptor 14J1-like n=1 Tax=Dryobates pubescens TaxID=118200 RepID=UPI0023B8FE96